MKIILGSKKESILVDDEDYEKLKNFHWFVMCQGYVVRWSPMKNGKRKWIKIHHEIMGKIPGFHVDHKDRNKLNNQKNNLRHATPVQNHCNSKVQAKSGYKGVFASRKRWKAAITHNGKSEYIGLYKTKEEAALAYNKKAIEYFGEFAGINIL